MQAQNTTMLEQATDYLAWLRAHYDGECRERQSVLAKAHSVCTVTIYRWERELRRAGLAIPTYRAGKTRILSWK